MFADKPILDPRIAGTRMVFSAIRQASPVPRIDIAKATGLSPATVTSITAELLRKGLIEEIPLAPTTTATKRGRPRVNLKVRGQAHLVAGIKLSDTSVSVAILDFDGNRMASYTYRSKQASRSPAQAVVFLKQALGRALKDAGLQLSDISGIGIGLPGVIDTHAGRVLWSPIISQRDSPLQQMLSDAFARPVVLDNDANLVAVGEQRFGFGRNSRNFIVVTIEQGVGIGIVIEGRLYRGTHGCGAELGHAKIQLDGALCRCGQRGCLEAYVGDYALLREAGTAIESVAKAKPKDQMDILLSEAGSGNAQALSILGRAQRMFAMGLANMVNIFAPEMIILSGARVQNEFLFNDNLIKEMGKSIVQVGTTPPRIHIRKRNDQESGLGAAVHAIDNVTEIALGRTAAYEI